MNKVTKMFLNLTVVGLVSGGALAVVFGVADPLIQINKENEIKRAIFEVLPGTKDVAMLKKGSGKDALTIYVGIAEDKTPVGVAFKADGNGFSGNVGVMVGIDIDYMKLKGIEILDQLETPGLGDRIRETEFKEQFRNIDAKPRVEYIKFRKPEKPNQIQAITGATISSDAVVKNINRAVARVEAAFTKDDLLAAKPEVPKAKESGKKAEGSKDGGK